MSSTADGQTALGREADRHPVFGGWSATRWQYTSVATPERSVDVVCDLGGSVALSLTATAFILTCDVAGRGSGSLSGACDVRGDELRLTADTVEGDGWDGANLTQFRQAGETLSLRSDESAWDFDGKGHEQPARFVAVLVRL